MKKLFHLLAIVPLWISCSSGSSTDDTISMPDPDSEPVPAATAEAPDLLEPINGEVCSLYSATDDENIVTVPFSWTNSSNAAQYEITLTGENLDESKTVSGTNTTFDINRDMVFEWAVTGINTDNVRGGTSTTFSFRTPGVSQSNVVPYVVIDLTLDNTEGMASLSWEGFDDDGDILEYDVIIKEDEMIILEQLDLLETSVGDFLIIDGALYEVIITVRDDNNNSSNTTEIKRNV